MKPRLRLILATALLTFAVVPVATCVGRREDGQRISLEAGPVAMFVRSIAGVVYPPHQIVVLDEVVITFEPGLPPVAGALAPLPGELQEFQVCTQWRPIAVDSADQATRAVHTRVCDVVDPASPADGATPHQLRAPRSRVEFESSLVAPTPL